MIELDMPILIYDNLCYSCTKFARLADNLVQGKCVIVGHYSTVGKEIKKQLFPKGYDGLEMFWFIINGYAYGGRAGLLRLIQYILFEKKKGEYPHNEFCLTECTTDCKTVKGVFLRSHSIITNYKKFSINNEPTVDSDKK
jgi:hypothetical protein